MGDYLLLTVFVAAVVAGFLWAWRSKLAVDDKAGFVGTSGGVLMVLVLIASGIWLNTMSGSQSAPSRGATMASWTFLIMLSLSFGLILGSGVIVKLEQRRIDVMVRALGGPVRRWLLPSWSAAVLWGAYVVLLTSIGVAAVALWLWRVQVLAQQVNPTTQVEAAPFLEEMSAGILAGSVIGVGGFFLSLTAAAIAYFVQRRRRNDRDEIYAEATDAWLSGRTPGELVRFRQCTYELCTRSSLYPIMRGLRRALRVHRRGYTLAGEFTELGSPTDPIAIREVAVPDRGTGRIEDIGAQDDGHGLAYRIIWTRPDGSQTEELATSGDIEVLVDQTTPAGGRK